MHSLEKTHHAWFDSLLFFSLFYFVIRGDFNFISSRSMVETGYNIVFSMVGLFVISVFGGSSLV